MYHHEVIYRSKRLFTARRLLHFSITTYYTSRSAKQGQGQHVKGSIINWSEPIRNKISIRGIIIVQCSYWSHLPLGQPELWEISKVNILTYHTGRLASQSHERYQRSVYLLITPAAWPIRAKESHEKYQKSIYLLITPAAWPLRAARNIKRSIYLLITLVASPIRAMRDIKCQYTYLSHRLFGQSEPWEMSKDQ